MRAAGEYIRKHAPDLGRKAAEMQFRIEPDLKTRYGPAGLDKCVEDTTYHLVHLAEAVAFAAPELFDEYAGWCKQLLAACGVPEEDLARNLQILRQTLMTELPEEFQHAIGQFLDRAIEQLPGYPNESPGFIDGGSALSGLAQTYLDKVLTGDGTGALQMVLSATEAGAPVTSIHEHVVAPCLREIGRLWQRRAITEAQEHYSARATERLLSLLTAFFPPVVKDRRVFMGLCVANEQHDLGLRLLADTFEISGWRAVHLGANVPARSLPGVLRLWLPDVVGISVTMTFHLPELHKVIATIRQEPLKTKPKILIGGPPFNVAKELCKAFDADGCAEDGRRAMALLS